MKRYFIFFAALFVLFSFFSAESKAQTENSELLEIPDFIESIYANKSQKQNSDNNTWPLGYKSDFSDENKDEFESEEISEIQNDTSNEKTNVNLQLENWKNNLEKQYNNLTQLQKNIENYDSFAAVREVQSEQEINYINKRRENIDELLKSFENYNHEFPLREIELNEQKNELNKYIEKISTIETDLLKQKDGIQKIIDELNTQIQELENNSKTLNENNEFMKSSEVSISKYKYEFNEYVTNFQENIKSFDSQDIKAKENSQNLKKQRSLLVQSRKKILEYENLIKILQPKIPDIQNKIETHKTYLLDEIKKTDILEDLFKTQISELNYARKQFDDALKIITPYSQTNSNVPLRINSTVTKTDGAIMNWSENYMEATGVSAVPTQFKGTNKETELARHNAILDLQKNLYEAVKLLNVNSISKIEDFMEVNSVRSSIEDTVKNAEINEGNQNGDSYVVKGRIRLDKIHNEIANRLSRNEPGYTPRSRKSRKSRTRIIRSADFTGLIIDARHLPVKPSMFIRILDEEGDTLYGVNFGNRDFQNQYGLYVWYNRMVYARDEQRVGRNPLVIKAQRLSNANKDIVIPNYAAVLLRDNAYDFRRECSVVIVKD